jgi:hypothetical protein
MLAMFHPWQDLALGGPVALELIGDEHRERRQRDGGWNTVQMTRIINQLRAAGEVITESDLARVSPLAFSHVIPNGVYFTRSLPPPSDEERLYLHASGA